MRSGGRRQADAADAAGVADVPGPGSGAELSPGPGPETLVEQGLEAPPVPAPDRRDPRPDGSSADARADAGADAADGPGGPGGPGGQLLFVRDGRVVELDPGTGALGPDAFEPAGVGWERGDRAETATLHGLCEGCLALTDLALHEGRYLCEGCRDG